MESPPRRESSSEEYEELKDPVSEYIREHCLPGLMPAADLRLLPSGLALPREFLAYLDRIRDFEVRPDDVWVVSYPKCGTIWTQEMVWLIGNDLDYETAKNQLIYQRFPFLEAVGIISEEQRTGDDEWVFAADTITYCEEMPSPRCIKSHLPVGLLPRQIWEVKPKIIYLTRNPKDAAVSYYHHHRLWNGYNGSYKTFMQGFLEDKLVFSPFWDHVLEYKQFEREPNFLINSFEEMKKDLPSVVRRTASFLGRHLRDEEVTRLCQHLNFSRMKENGAINGEELIKELKQRHGLDSADPNLSFIRKGEVGSWKDEMPKEIAQQFDDWTEEKTKGTSLQLSQ